MEGRVQGVGFRFFVVRHAGRLGLNGWTRNMPDGSVYIVAEGPMRLLSELLAAVREGPPASAVSNVVYNMSEPLGEVEGFYIW